MRDWPNRKVLVDVHATNIDVCRSRFATVPNVEFVVNNGYDLSALPDQSVSAVFSYDAMVHFDHTVVGSYLGEIRRTLRPGGMALIHHSNYGGNPGGSHRSNPHWRNFMPPGLFLDYATKAGLQIIQHVVIDWSGVRSLDAVTLLSKPS
jgi:ubiquinone/menaquinone biosynthesis C-methylase UbiE